MLAHLFRRGDSHLHCLSRDPQGGNIPCGFAGGDWRYVMAVDLQANEQRLSVDSDEALADLAARGYHFVDGWYRQL